MKNSMENRERERERVTAAESINKSHQVQN